MLSEQTILACERLRDDVTAIGRLLKDRYKQSSQVTSADIKLSIRRCAETWLVEIATDKDVAAIIGPNALADLNVNFQRLLSYAEHASLRKRYDTEIKLILKSYTAQVILPLKQSRGRPAPIPSPSPQTASNTAFLGQSFSSADKSINEFVRSILEAIGVKIVTGERPKADIISDKVKRSIDEQAIFVGIFSRRDKIARKPEWTTSPWVIDEKAYAVGKQKPLILLKEQGVGSIGGIQGDYEYIEFDRERLGSLALQ